MYWDVVEVRPEPDYCLFLRFKDGLSGRVQLRCDELTCVPSPCWMRSFSSECSWTMVQSHGPARSIWRRMQCTFKSPASRSIRAAPDSRNNA
jgi:hypothetical protein